MMGKLALAGSTVIVANTELTPNNGTIGSKPGQTHVPDCAIFVYPNFVLEQPAPGQNYRSSLKIMTMDYGYPGA